MSQVTLALEGCQVKVSKVTLVACYCSEMCTSVIEFWMWRSSYWMHMPMKTRMFFCSKAFPYSGTNQVLCEADLS